MDDGVGIGGHKLGCREAHELRKLVDQRGERGDLPLDQARTFLDQLGQFRIARRRRLRDVAALEESQQPLGGKLNRRQGIFDFMSDAPRDFLPRGRFLCAEHFREIIEDEDVAGVRPARAQGTHRDSEVQHASGGDRLDLSGDHSHAQGSAHQVVYDAGRIRAEKPFERVSVRAANAEHSRNRSIHAKNGARGVERNHPRGNVLQNGFHELAPPLEFLHRLLKIPGELIDLRAAVA